MSQIHILDGQSNQGEILDYITAKNIINDNHKKSKEDTLETYDFIAFADKRFSEFLEKRNRIIIPDEDDTLREFIIFEAARYKDSEGYKSQIYTHASYLELKKATILYPDKGYTGTASQHGGRALNDTGWQIGIVESKGTRTLTIENHTNPFAFLKRIAKEFELELRFRVEHDGNKITGRYVDLLEQVGEWRGREAEFGKDLDGIRRVEKQDIVTALLGLGPEKEDGTRLEVLVEDEDALKRWGRVDEYGNLHHLIEPYEIQSERSEMTESEARQYTRTALNKRINTQVTYEGSIVDLENVPGMENKKIRFGDTIRIKDTKFNPPLYLEARIFEQTRSIKSKAKKDIKLGDFVEFTEEEVNNIWDQLRKDIQKRVTAAQMAEYTYSKMLIDEKDEIVFEDGKTFAEATGIEAKEHADFKANEAETNAKGYAELKADEARSAAEKVAEAKAELAELEAKAYADGEVTKEQKRAIQDAQEKLEQAMADAKTKADAAEKAAKDYAVEQDGLLKTTVEGYADRVAQQQADSALSSAKQYAVAKEVYENEMVKIASDIEGRAPLEYVDGKFTVVEDDLKNFNVELDKKVDGSTVYTIEDVDNMINNTVSKTEYTADMDDVVSDIESHGTRIGQNEKAIGLKVDSSELDAVESSLTTKIGNVEVTAEGASMTASEVRADLDGLEIGGRNLYTHSGPPYDGNYAYSPKRETVDGVDSLSWTGSRDILALNNFGDVLEEGKEYTFSFLAKASKELSIGRVHINAQNSSNLRNEIISTKWKKYSFTFTVKGDNKSGRVHMYPEISNDDGTSETFYLANWKLEKGNKATDWTPAPEDIDESINQVGGRVETLDASVETLAGEVSLKAEQSVVDSLENQVENHEAELNVLPGQIELKADAAVVDGIDDRLGSAEIIIDGLESEIKLKADLVDIEGMLTADDLAVRKDLEFGGVLRGPEGVLGNITVNEGDITFQDTNSNMAYGVKPQSNLIGDPSFEQVMFDFQTISETYNWSEMIEPADDYFPHQPYWRKVGSPKIALPTDYGNVEKKALPIFGERAAVVRKGDYVRQYIMFGFDKNETYSISAYFKRHWQQTAGTPRLEVFHMRGGGIVSTLLEKDFEKVPNDYSEVRFGDTFTTSSNFDTDDYLTIKVMSSNSNWVQSDGVQVIKGSTPTLYPPNDEIYSAINNTLQQSMLWSGAHRMVDGQTIRINKRLSDCNNGWMLVWQRIISGEGIRQSHFNYTPILKSHGMNNSGDGLSIPLAYSNGIPLIRKYLYVHNDRITGHDYNSTGDSANLALGAVFEW